MEKASFWRRLFAYCLDNIIIGVVWGGLTMFLEMDPLVENLIVLIITAVYFIVFWATNGQPLGHRALGIKVVMLDGSPLTYGKAILRFIGYCLCDALLGIGYLWVIFDKNKQGWHDKIAGTIVVKA